MDGVLTVDLLGGFRVGVEGRAFPADTWRHRRGADLVKLLALAPGRRLHREQVMDALWPDLSPEAAAANLRKATHFARQALGSEGSIKARGEMLALWPGGEVVLDAERFETAAREALSSLDPGALAGAAGLYAGELLPEDRYAGWTAELRERLRLLHLEVLRRAQMWERVLDVDRANEEAHRALMHEHLEAGDRTAAMRQFERLRAALREELGVAPDAESVSLYEKVLAMEGREPPTLDERARSLLAEGLGHWNRQDLAAAERAAREARAIAIDAGLGHELGEASALLGLVSHASGTWREMFHAEFLDIIGRKPELATFVFDAHVCFAEFSLYGSEGHEEIAPFARDLLERAEEAGSIHGRAVAVLLLGEIEMFSGRLDEAERDFLLAVRLHDEVEADTGRALSLERLAETSTAQGRRWQARRLLTRARRFAERGRLVSHMLPRVLCAMVGAAPDAASALATVDAAESALAGREVCQPCSMGYRVAAAIACARAGELARSRHHLADAERIAGMWQGGPWLAAVWEARGVLRQAEGDASQAAALFREAADGFARVKRSMDEARCRAGAAAALIVGTTG